MSTTIMLLTYNRLGLIKKTFESIEKLTEPHNLVIVDNHGEAEVTEWIKNLENTYCPSNLLNLHVIYNYKNKGVAAGRNQALKAAAEIYDTDFFVTMDPDIEFSPTAVTDCVNILKDCKQYAAIGINLEGIEYPIHTINGHTFQTKPMGNLGAAFMCFPKWIFKTLGYFKVEKDNNNNNLQYTPDDADYGSRMRVISPQIKLGYAANGVHLGGNEDPNDKYRKWKNDQYSKSVPLYKATVPLYYSRQKQIYIPYKD